MNERRQKEILIFNDALNLPSLADRATYLDQACAGDKLLRERLEALLRVHSQADSFFETAKGDAGARLFEAAAEPLSTRGTVRLGSVTEQTGDRIGRYKLLQKIGEGGCGVVYMAEQEEPVRRRVALKVIKLGMDTKSVIARFEAERQALAMMDHPNIARVLDAGATETGRPYFVMELVKGVKITEYCDRNSLSTPRRLALFAQVCRALQHAHQKGIIHRDIKPSNILITLDDGVPVPKVIDFGIAKATTEQRLTDKTLFTAFEQFIGTPAYMSPEQAEMSGLDIDTRSDIYGLGVLLYELLTGKTPFDGTELVQSGIDELRRKIREEEPQKPSTRLRTMLGLELTATAAQRQTEPPRLIHSLRGELDWIVMKALEKDRTRRYDSASSFAEDVDRYLKDEPVAAAAPSVSYQAVKFVRRHRAAVSFVAALAFTVLAGSGISVWQSVRASKQALLAKARHREAESSRQQAAAAQKRAEHFANEVSHQLARQYVDKGSLRMDQDDAFGSLLWFAEALRLDEGDPQLEATDRLRIGTLLERCPKLLQFFSQKSPALTAEFSSDGQRLVTAAGIWDVNTGELLVTIPPHEPEPLTLTLSPRDLRSGMERAGRGKGEGSVQGFNVRRVASEHSLSGGDVISAAFSPDGQRIVTASEDKTARVWNASTGAPIAPSVQHAGNVWSVAFSPDGRRIVTASEDKTARVWDAGTGQPIPPPLHHDGVVWTAAFSPDGRFVLTASEDKTAQIWDAQTGQRVTPPLPHGGKVWWAAFSPDGQLAGTASEDHTARLWDARTGKPLSEPLRHDEEVVHLAFSPDGHRLVTASGESIGNWPLEFKNRKGEARVWDVKTGKPLTPPMRHKSSVFHATFSPDGRYVATASKDQTARVWNAITGEPVTPPLLHDDIVFRASFSPDGRRLVTTGFDGAVKIWGLSETQLLPPAFPHSVEVTHVGLSGDGRRIGTAGPDASARIWDAETGAPITPPLQHGQQVRDVTFSPDGRRVVTSSNDKTARVWDASNGNPISPPLPYSGQVLQAAFSPDSRRVVARSDDGTARVWDAETGAAITPPLVHAAIVTHVIFSPDGRRVATASRDGTARVWDANTGAAITPPLPHNGKNGVWRVAFSPDSSRLATASQDGTARIWNAETGAPIIPLLKHGGPDFWGHGVEHVSFSPDGQRIVTASDDKTARVWDVSTGAPVTPPLQHSQVVLDAAFSHNGRYVVTASEDKSARVWDVSTGQPITLPLRHDGDVGYALFTAEDRRVITVSLDRHTRSVRVWSWDLASDNRPVKALRSLARVLSLHRMDATGTLVPLDTESVSNAWRELRAR